MTLKEAIGVHMGNIDVETGKELSHSEVYGRAIELLGGLDEVAKYVPYPVDVIRKKLKKDWYLNNTKITAWNFAAGFMRSRGTCKLVGCGIWELYRKHNITSASCAEGVCLLKEAARRLAERSKENA